MWIKAALLRGENSEHLGNLIGETQDVIYSSITQTERREVSRDVQSEQSSLEAAEVAPPPQSGYAAPVIYLRNLENVICG